MTKAKAKKIMSEHSRSIIDPKFASKIAKVYGYKLKDLLKPQRMDTFRRAIYSDPNVRGITVYRLAQVIAKKQNPEWEPKPSPFNGVGSTADFYTKDALAVIR